MHNNPKTEHEQEQNDNGADDDKCAKCIPGVLTKCYSMTGCDGKQKEPAITVSVSREGRA